MSKQEVDISTSRTGEAIKHAEEMERDVKEALRLAKELQATVSSSLWSGQTRDAFLSYVDLIIQLNVDMVDTLEVQTKALIELEDNIHSFSSTKEVQIIKSL
ncbi:WXG100 family type VII secretion target [Priestia taiwanensis]|uniref:WXG100 family type VII secretion target n=1 Tax=Priestia taiwanensis TaxID=1347902 RepID=A0A917AL43_9BACI|nr:WXG100 family type VII secretion target [Priestia taiwanensis]MBM7362092.1 hypothetical protein [Priestia taiwanensis]GGE59385.1 hypothetical protein GCM10007140_07150 [Priestia taiwanensis]